VGVRSALQFGRPLRRREPLGFLGGLVALAIIFVAIFGGALAPNKS